MNELCFFVAVGSLQGPAGKVWHTALITAASVGNSMCVAQNKVKGVDYFIHQFCYKKFAIITVGRQYPVGPRVLLQNTPNRHLIAFGAEASMAPALLYKSKEMLTIFLDD